jgi:hypothetical protein
MDSYQCEPGVTCYGHVVALGLEPNSVVGVTLNHSDGTFVQQTPSTGEAGGGDVRAD